MAKYQDVSLMVVSKNRSVEDIVDLINLGQKVFGENRVQEAKKKFNFDTQNIELHLIGPLQTNKVKDALRLFDVIQSVDRKKIIDIIYDQVNDQTKTKSFFIQVNIGEEPQKSGVMINELPFVYEYALSKKLNIQGFMCIPPAKLDPRIFFEKMIKLKKQFNPDLLLSMGMSNDYKIALECESNFIRIGSKIFND